MPSLALSNIRRRKFRSAISVLAIGLGIALFLVLVGVTKGTVGDLVNRIKKIGADIAVQPADSSFFLAMKSSLMSIDYKDDIASIDGVKAVAPVLTWAGRVKGTIYVSYGIEPESFSKIGAKIEIIKGRNVFWGKEVVVDSRFAEKHKVDVGDKIKYMGKRFEIVGICKPGIAARIFMPLATLQRKMNQEGKVSVFFVKCHSPSFVKRVSEEIESVMPNVKIAGADEISSIVSKSLTGLNEFVTAISAFTIFMSALVVFLAMYTTVYERGREIGILKSLGAGHFFIAKEVILESLILSMFGVLAGYGIAFIAREVMKTIYPTLTVDFSYLRMWYAFGAGITIGVLGAMLPAISCSRKDPVLALRYE